MSAFNALNAALATKLRTGTALTALLACTGAVYYMEAPDNAALDYVVYSLQGGGDTNDTANRVKDLVYYIRAYSDDSAAKAGSIDAQIDALIHGTTLTVTGWANIWCAREEDIALIEDYPSGVHIYNAGGMYRIMLDKN
jgi:hypothetical protein